MSENIQENKMGVMPVPKLLFNMAIPMQALYNIVDSAFVGMYSTHALEAVSIAFPIQNLMIAFATGTGVGINALLSRHLGEKKFEAADTTANTGLFLAICSYILFAILGLTIVRPFFSMQSDIAEVVNYGEEYLTVILLCGFGIFGEITNERLLQATGRTVYSMITQGTGAVLNIILDPIMIFGYCGMPALGVKGAAIATVIGQCVAFILALTFNIKVNKEVNIRISKIFKPQLQEIIKIYEIGIPSIIMTSITSFLTVGMNLILKKFSEDAITVFGVYFKLNSFVFMPVFGLNNGMVPILSYNYGAKKHDRIIKTVRLGMSCAVIYMLAGLAVFEIMPDKLLMIFSASENVMNIGVTALRIIALSFIFAGIGIVSSTVFQSIGNPLHSLLISVLRQLVIILPVAYLLSLTGSVSNVWWSYPIAEVASFILSVFFLRKTFKKLNREVSG